MNLLLFDNACSKNFNINDLKNDNFVVGFISDIAYDKNNFENIYIVCNLSYNFLETDAIEFLKTQTLFPNCKIILINSIYSYTSENVAEEWISLLAKIKKYNYIVLKKVQNEKCLDIFDIISQNDYQKQNKALSKNITIYTDGACSGNPGAGGWACIIKFDNETIELSGGVEDTTNNRMELLAVINALEYLTETYNIKIYSDSAYVVNAFLLGWLKQWKRLNWKNSEGKPVKNLDLWQKLDHLVLKHNVEFLKVKGHSTNKLNNRCDELAVNETIKIQNGQI